MRKWYLVYYRVEVHAEVLKKGFLRVILLVSCANFNGRGNCSCVRAEKEWLLLTKSWGFLGIRLNPFIVLVWAYHVSGYHIHDRSKWCYQASDAEMSGSHVELAVILVGQVDPAWVWMVLFFGAIVVTSSCKAAQWPHQPPVTVQSPPLISIYIHLKREEWIPMVSAPFSNFLN